jgi:hypothetical protein
MSISLIIFSVGLLSAVCTSIIASIMHKMSWHKTMVKSKFKCLNLCLSNFYQFNDRFYNAFPFFRELMINSLIITLYFKVLICRPNPLAAYCIVGVLLLVFFLRTISLLIVYTFFYDEELVK